MTSLSETVKGKLGKMILELKCYQLLKLAIELVALSHAMYKTDDAF